MTTNQPCSRLQYSILTKTLEDITWHEFIRYETKEECISYLENVNPTLRPAIIVKGQQTLRGYDTGIIDYEDIARIERENIELRDKMWEVRKS